MPNSIESKCKRCSPFRKWKIAVLFNSKIFISFIIATLSIYYFLPDRWKVLFLLAMSYLFYGFWDPSLCSLIALSTVVDYWCGRKIAEHTVPKTRKRWLYLSLFTNLGILGFFKYYDFFVEEFVLAFNFLGFALQSEDYLLNLMLPVGISFYKLWHTALISIEETLKSQKNHSPVLRWMCHFSHNWLLVQLSEPHICCHNFLGHFDAVFRWLKRAYFWFCWGLSKK